MRDDWTELVERAKEGDKDAFAKLVQRFKGPICSAIHPMVRDWHLTQDVAQEAFTAAYERLGELRESRHFRAWLYRIARNRAVSRVRRSICLRMQSLSALTDEKLADLKERRRASTPEEEEETGPCVVTLAKVRRIIMNLPNGYGSILLMHHVEGLSLKEMSEALGRTSKAVKAVLYRARLLARGYLEIAGLDYERVFYEL